MRARSLTVDVGAPPRAPRGQTIPGGLIAVSLGFLMITLDATIVNVAVGAIGADLGGGLTAAQWIVAAYGLPFAALLLSAGSLSDGLGARRGLLAGLALFALGSGGCSAAPTLGVLIATRVVQGIGAAMVMPCSLALLAHLFPAGAGRTRALAVWGGMSGVGLASGLLLGGALVDAIGWRAIFLVNLPVAALAAALLRSVPESPRRRRALDGPGQLLGTCALATLTAAFIFAGDTGWTSAATGWLLGAAVASAAAFVLWEWRAVAPMVPLGLFAARPFSASVTIGALFNFCLYGGLFCLTIVFVQARGMSPFEAGCALLPLALLVSFTTFLSGHLIRRLGEWEAILAGLSAGAVGSALLALSASDTPIGVLVAGSLGLGLTALAMPAMTSICIGAVAPLQTGLASGVLNAARQAGGSLGVAVLGALLHAGGGGPMTLRPAFAAVAAGYGLGLAIAGFGRAARR